MLRGSISVTGDAADGPGPEACAKALGLCGLENSHLHKSHLAPLHESTLWASQPRGLTDPSPHQTHSQFCGERKRCIKERNKDDKSLRVSAGQVLPPVNY